MSLSKATVVDRIEILQSGQIQVRTATVVSEDGVELSRGFHRHVLSPGDDTAAEEQRVQDVAAATWTAEVLSDWAERVAARDAEREAGG